MSLNRLHSIFGKNRKLSRDDIKEYGQTKNESFKNEIEQTALSNDFDREAMEGWEHLSYDTSVLNKLDQRFIRPKNYRWIWVSGTALTLLLVILFITSLDNNLPQNTIIAENSIVEPINSNEIIVEESDLIIPTIIDEMVVRPVKDQIKPEEIKADYATRDPDQENFTHLEIEALPINSIEETNTQATLIVSRKSGKA